MLTIIIPIDSNGYFHVTNNGRDELFSCYNHEPKNVDLAIDIINIYNMKGGEKVITPQEALIIKLDLQIRCDTSQLEIKKFNLKRLREEKEQMNVSHSVQ